MRNNCILLSLTIIIGFAIMPATGNAAPFVCGDADASEEVDIDDVVYLIEYIFAGGPEPVPYESGDPDASEAVDIDDVVYLINYIFAGGSEPYCVQYTIPSSTTIIPYTDTTVIQDYDSITGDITLDESSVYAQEIEVGDIAIGQDDSVAPYGFLRKVISKTTMGNSVILETDTATMMEAFDSLYVKETNQLRPSDVVSYKLHDGVRYTSTKDDDLFNVELYVVLYDQDGNHETTDDQIRLDGNLAFSAALFTEIEIEWLWLKKFEAGIESGQEANVDLTASLQWEFGEELEFDLAEYHLGVIWVGPIALVPTLTIEAHIRGDLTVTFQTGISFTQDVRYGFGWEPDGWYTISESTKEFIYTPPQFTAEFNFEPGVSLNASVMVYGLAGPYVAAKAGFHFQAALNADPCDVELLFDLHAILYALVGIECDLLGLDYNWEWELYAHLIWEDTYPLGGSGTILIDPEPDILNAPWSLAGPCSYSSSGNGDETLASLDPGDYTITWGEVSGWTTPSGETQNLAAEETLTFTGTYIEDVGTGTIVIDPSPDSINAPWSLVGPDSFSDNGTGDETLTELTPGDYTITWEDVMDWITPVGEMQTLVADETVTFFGDYVAESGSTGTVTDIDGNVYQTIMIGDQWWMAENLKVTHYRNSDPIPHVTDGGTWSGLSTGAYCEYDNNPANVETYGRMYNWHAVDDSRGIAPEGWHVPTDDEWKQLEMYLGMSQAEADGTGWRGTDEGGKLKEIGTTHWQSPNTGATNESGFTALPGGYRNHLGAFGNISLHGGFWSSSQGSSSNAWHRYLYYAYSQIHRHPYYRVDGFSVRCVQD